MRQKKKKKKKEKEKKKRKRKRKKTGGVLNQNSNESLKRTVHSSVDDNGPLKLVFGVGEVQVEPFGESEIQLNLRGEMSKWVK